MHDLIGHSRPYHCELNGALCALLGIADSPAHVPASLADERSAKPWFYANFRWIGCVYTT